MCGAFVSRQQSMDAADSLSTGIDRSDYFDYSYEPVLAVAATGFVLTVGLATHFTKRTLDTRRFDEADSKEKIRMLASVLTSVFLVGFASVGMLAFCAEAVLMVFWSSELEFQIGQFEIEAPSDVILPSLMVLKTTCYWGTAAFQFLKLTSTTMRYRRLRLPYIFPTNRAVITLFVLLIGIIFESFREVGQCVYKSGMTGVRIGLLWDLAAAYIAVAVVMSISLCCDFTDTSAKYRTELSYAVQTHLHVSGELRVYELSVMSMWFFAHFLYINVKEDMGNIGGVCPSDGYIINAKRVTFQLVTYAVVLGPWSLSCLSVTGQKLWTEVSGSLTEQQRERVDELIASVATLPAQSLKEHRKPPQVAILPLHDAVPCAVQVFVVALLLLSSLCATVFDTSWFLGPTGAYNSSVLEVQQDMHNHTATIPADDTYDNDTTWVPLLWSNVGAVVAGVVWLAVSCCWGRSLKIENGIPKPADAAGEPQRTGHRLGSTGATQCEHTDRDLRDLSDSEGDAEETSGARRSRLRALYRKAEERREAFVFNKPFVVLAFAVASCVVEAVLWVLCSEMRHAVLLIFSATSFSAYGASVYMYKANKLAGADFTCIPYGLMLVTLVSLLLPQLLANVTAVAVSGADITCQWKTYLQVAAEVRVVGHLELVALYAECAAMTVHAAHHTEESSPILGRASTRGSQSYGGTM